MLIAVQIIPTFEPAFNKPLANERSCFGNHSAVVLTADGKLVDSPKPSNPRNTRKSTNDFAKPVSNPAILHIIIPIENPFLVPSLSINQPAIRKPMAYKVLNAASTNPICSLNVAIRLGVRTVFDETPSTSRLKLSSVITKLITCLSI